LEILFVVLDKSILFSLVKLELASHLSQTMCSTFQVNDALSVVCFRRNHSLGPYFAVREFDTKVIRSSSKNKKIGRGPSEQAIRASIRQAILNMSLRSERASKSEIRMLKQQGILGKRAPSCALLCADDMLKLLEAFDRPEESSDLRKALEKEGKKPKEEKDAETEPLDPTPSAVDSGPDFNDSDSGMPAVPSVKRTSARIKRRLTHTRSSPHTRPSKSPSPTGLDALLQAMEAGPVGSEEPETGPRGEKQRRIVLEQAGPVAAARPYDEGVFSHGVPINSDLQSEAPVQFLPQQFLPVMSFSDWQESTANQEIPQPIALPEETIHVESSSTHSSLMIHPTSQSFELSSMERYSPSGQIRPFQTSLMSPAENFPRQTLVL